MNEMSAARREPSERRARRQRVGRRGAAMRAWFTAARYTPPIEAAVLSFRWRVADIQIFKKVSDEIIHLLKNLYIGRGTLEKKYFDMAGQSPSLLIKILF